ncbi:hypothetical protein BD779DRAFT_784310 [Infundibulicybe gibba]|nr:hypothetical protein BD779DRAFT_784310 [Infundibulicybe gibba]
MHFTKLLSLVFFAALVSHVQAASNDCCHCIDASEGIDGHCGDGTGCTPYCGYGPCNIFGCNCDGGCRGGISNRASPRSLADTGLAAADATENRFNEVDANHDGQLTFEEWAAADENKNADKDVLAAHWAKFDSAGAGYLTKADVASRIA